MDFLTKISRLGRIAKLSKSLEAIGALWAEDAKMHPEDMDRESRRTPELHSKYYNIWISEKNYYRNLNSVKDEYYSAAFAYYGGELNTPDGEYKKYGFEHPQNVGLERNDPFRSDFHNARGI